MAVLSLVRKEPKSAIRRIARSISRGPLHIALVGATFLWLLPTLGLLVTSFRPAAEANQSGWWNVLGQLNQLTLSNYQSILDDSRIAVAILNTGKIAVASTILIVLLAALAAYALSWIQFPGRDWLFPVMVGLLVVPLQMALIPAARLFGVVGIFDTIWAAIVFHVAFGLPFAIFLLRNFFKGIPVELLDAARVDGASDWQIFSRIMLPLGVPAIASLTVFQFMWTWNDLLVALTFTSGDSAPLTVIIRQDMRQFGANLDIIAPGAFLLMVVPLLVFFAFQRYFIQGLLAGSIK